MTARTPELLRRNRAVLAVQKRFAGAACDFAAADCIRAVRMLLVKMGHRGLPQLPRYRDAAGARRALGARGFDSVAGLLDSLLPRVAPARLRQGDVIAVAGAHGLEACFIFVGGDKFMGWHAVNDFAEPVAMTPNPGEIIAAWSVM